MKKWLFLPFLFPGCAAPRTAEQIESVIRTQEAAWNRGDLEGFMEGYDKSSSLTFASGGSITYGWQETLDRYKKHYDTPEKIGRLHFDDLKVFPLDSQAALVLGRWTLERAADKPNGLFTLLFRKKPEGWRIVLDHTSSAP